VFGVDLKKWMFTLVLTEKTFACFAKIAKRKGKEMTEEKKHLFWVYGGAGRSGMACTCAECNKTVTK